MTLRGPRGESTIVPLADVPLADVPLADVPLADVPLADPWYAASVLETLPILITGYPALLPEAVAFLAITGSGDAAVARAARRSEEPFTFAVFARQDGQTMRIGCAALVEEVVAEHGQLLGLRVRGLARVELLGPADDADADKGPPRMRVRVLDAPVPVDALLRAQLARVKTRLPNLRGVGLAIDPAVSDALAACEAPGRFADLLAAQLDLEMDQRLALLGALDPAARLVLVDRLLDAAAAPPTSQLGRVWASLREPCNAVPSHSSLRVRAKTIDTAALHDLRLRHTVEAMIRTSPILVVDVDDSRELEARRESLSQLTSAVRSLAAVSDCGGPQDADLQAEIAASIAFLLAVIASEHAEIQRTR